MADDDDDLYDAVTGMADRMGLKGRERRKYVHDHMTRGGYDAVPQYVKRENDDDDGEEEGFAFGRRRSSRRRDDDDDDDRSNRSRRRSRGDDGDGWYG